MAGLREGVSVSGGKFREVILSWLDRSWVSHITSPRLIFSSSKGNDACLLGLLYD